MSRPSHLKRVSLCASYKTSIKIFTQSLFLGYFCYTYNLFRMWLMGYFSIWKEIWVNWFVYYMQFPFFFSLVSTSRVQKWAILMLAKSIIVWAFSVIGIGALHCKTANTYEEHMVCIQNVFFFSFIVTCRQRKLAVFIDDAISRNFTYFLTFSLTSKVTLKPIGWCK